MPYTDEERNYIYDKTRGYCNYCGKKLSYTNYGRRGKHGAWHIDHSKSKANGGTEYLRNKFPACIDCNTNKGALNGKYYKKKFEPVTLGGQLVRALGLPDGFMGASRRKRLI